MAAASSSSPKLIVFGEFFIDLVFYDLPDVPRMGHEVKTRSFAELPGGGLATTALVAATLGTATAAITRIGSDARTSLAWKKVSDGGVSTAACEFSPRLPTARTVCAAYNGDRMMITHDAINARLDKLLTQSAVERQLRRAKHIHLACDLRPLPQWYSLIRRLRAQGLTVSADIGWNPRLFKSPGLLRLLGELEFIFPNEIEALEMTGQRSVERALSKLGGCVRVPVIKLGKAGSVAIVNGKSMRARSIRVRSIDATGAGDAFNGGFLHGYLAGWPLMDCLRAGNVCGALATTAAGGSSAMPTLARLRKLIRITHN
ncbi:MAG TPA: carbohydrate kinase family protein [Terriglobales bacterium]|nr:carbohydrate kinase family protein [Terriglobales bacterium]